MGARRRKPIDINDDEFFEGVGIDDDLMFREVFGRDEVLAGGLLSCVLERDVGEVEYVHAQHEVRPEQQARATTFDVYLRTGDGTIGDIEMQNGHKAELPLRLRTHLSNMDRDAIKRGDRFADTDETVSVFICTFDPLGAGLRRYTVRRRVEETGELFPDRQSGVLLNAFGKGGDISAGLEAFLLYVAGYNGDDVMGDEFVAAVHGRVLATRGDWEWRRGYVTLQEKFDDIRAEALEEGLEQGKVTLAASLVAQGVIPVEVAAEQLGLTPEEFERAAADLEAK